jgi:hypothetical protein
LDPKAHKVAQLIAHLDGQTTEMVGTDRPQRGAGTGKGGS